jgi:endonuclease/exonuclease/phosphatase family metal-dependent hydrolase
MTRRLAVAAVAAAVGLVSAGAAAGAGERAASGRLTVETRNLFVGFDAGALLAGAITPAQAWSTLVLSNPAGRAERWADEIAAARPDVVGLQEAALIRTGPLLAAAPAATVAFDFVGLLLNALAARGLDYDAVATIENLDAEAPVGPPFFFDARVTDRDVLLVRGDRKFGQVKVLDASAGRYAAALPQPPFLVTRGWTAVDVKHRGRNARVVNTHLEAFHEGVRLAQAAELIAGPAANAGPTIVLGDMNSGPPAPTPTYGLLAGAFTDVWPVAGVGPGLTCCHPDLTPAAPFSKRIDLVLVDAGVAPLSAQVVGAAAAPAFPFYASDHAGVVATVKLP